MVDKNFCMSSYLMYRYVFRKDKVFQKGKNCYIADISFPRYPVKTAKNLLDIIEYKIKEACKDNKAALALSGGMDSAILAKFMPKDSKAYTFRCIVPGKNVIDESKQAEKWAKLCKIELEIIDIYWKDVEAVTEKLMLHKGMPIHSIETQIYIAAQKAKKDGFNKLIFGENADIIYGGMNGLLAQDWKYGEFVDRYTYVKPYYVLREPQMILEPFWEFEEKGYIDGYNFINKYFRQEALGTYKNACETAGIDFIGPYSMTYLDTSIDYCRIRSGDTKYLIREAFHILYPKEPIPSKIPMPRPMNEWFENWTGPIRQEFLPHSINNFSGDQKWMVWALEKYLNLIEKK